MQMQDLSSFEQFLKYSGLGESSIKIYIRVCADFLSKYKAVDLDSVVDYKGSLIRRLAPSTVNLYINVLNKWFKFLGRYDLLQKTIPVQTSSYARDTVSFSDYLTLKNYLKSIKAYRDYFAVWTMCSTGLRVSELLNLTTPDVAAGSYDVYGKGGKVRRVWLPATLSTDMGEWLHDVGICEGYVFLNRYGERLSARGLSARLKKHARACNIDESVVHPHAFRHTYARMFLDADEDIALLADLMGHSSIETTRGYLRRSATEQRAIVDKFVTW